MYRPHRTSLFLLSSSLDLVISDLHLDRDRWASPDPTVHDQSPVTRRNCPKPDFDLSIRISPMRFNPDHWSSRSNGYCVPRLHFFTLPFYLDFMLFFSVCCGSWVSSKVLPLAIPLHTPPGLYSVRSLLTKDSTITLVLQSFNAIKVLCLFSSSLYSPRPACIYYANLWLHHSILKTHTLTLRI